MRLPSLTCIDTQIHVHKCRHAANSPPNIRTYTHKKREREKDAKQSNFNATAARAKDASLSGSRDAS